MVETFRHQGDFTNDLEVRYHHSNWAEQVCQVVRKFRTTSVTRIHGDVNGASTVDLKLSSFENESRILSLDGNLDSEDLLGDHRKHF